MGKVIGLSQEQVTNDAQPQISLEEPWTAVVELRGSADILLHRYSNDAVAEKSKARKGSAAKKTDDLESYVYRNAEGVICLPGEYLRGSIVNAAKFRQDPRSPRKSAMDLFKASIVPLTALAPFNGNPKTWDYEDRRRVLVQRNAITRVRPAFRSGWSCEIELMVNTPEYIDEAFLLEILNMAGRLIGVGDFRPTFGRFNVTRFARLQG